MMKGDLVLIDWYDAFSIDAWQKVDNVILEVTEPMLCHTVGYIVADFETSITVCHTYNEDDQVCGSLQIPKCSIKGEIKKI